MKTKDIITELYKTGLSASEIAKLAGVTIRYVNAVISRQKPLSDNLTESNYIAAIKNNSFESKEELAAIFGITYRTLHRFEEKTGIIAKTAKYLYIQGKTEAEITALLHTKTSALRLHKIPTIAGVKSDLETVLEILKDYAQIVGDAQPQYYTLKRIYEKL